MDEYYNLPKAATDVQKWAESMCEGNTHSSPLWKVNLDDVQFVSTTSPPAVKAIIDGTEAIFSMVGAMTQRELPPVQGGRINTMYARQQATIVGIDTSAYNKAMENLDELIYRMEATFEPGQFILPNPGNVDNKMGISVTSSTRYFTVGRHIPMDSRIGFHEKVDPAGKLTELLSESIGHCFDNDVAYLDIKGDKLVMKDPSGFRIGDIVEMGFAAVAFKTRDSANHTKYHCKLVLRTLLFLDGTATKEAFHTRRKELSKIRGDKKQNNVMYNPIAKRRLAWEEQEDESDEEETRHKMARMNMS